MPNPKGQRPGRPHLQRDNQQWVFDYLIKETGKVYHWSSDGGNTVPRSVRGHAMISKHVGRQAQRLEAIAQAEDEAGHHHTALDLYFEAAKKYMQAQHPIFELNDEKRFLYAGLQRCYDKVRDLNGYRIERIDAPWDGTTVSGWLHLCPGLDKKPLLFYLPGCDVTCESWPDPAANLAHQRGMHVFSFDGPGQGASNMRGIRLTADNYEQAASAALDVLVRRPDVKAEGVVSYGSGMGSFWGMRFAAHDRRLRAIGMQSTFADKYHIMNEESPRWKQLFAFLTQAASEQELDAVMAAMTLDGYMDKISCATLMLAGEYDLRDPIDEVYRLFDQLQAPRELWVFADQFHRLSLGGGETVHAMLLDWLRDRLDGKPLKHDGEALYIEPGSAGPNSPTVATKRRWYNPSPSPPGRGPG